MANQKNGGTVAKSKNGLSSVIVALVLLGVVLGCWRYLGGGAGITDPAWIGNAVKNGQKMIGWGDGVGDNIKREVDQNKPSAPSAPTSPTSK